MKLNELAPEKGSRKPRKRLGRGVASGSGKTAGKGTKGHKSRSGGGVRPGFEGGQMPIQRRLPKRGFTNIFRKTIVALNLRDLMKIEGDGVIDKAALIRAGLVKGDVDFIKILGQGEVSRPVTIQLDKISKSAREKVLAAGGRIEG
jgi:large subunit ribosomal protein L15